MTVLPQTLPESSGVSFTDFGFAPFLSKTIDSVGYKTPTPIQAQAIPLLLEGHDLIGLAQTGTGKTAAFVLPLLQKLSGSKGRGSKALVLAPTRELVEQIREVVEVLGPRAGVKSTTVYGGVSHQRQMRELSFKPEIIVACPGRLLDHIRGGTVDLSTIEYLVLDEADRMLDMGFLPDIKKIISKLPKERQTMLFSATMPKEIEALSREVLRDPTTVRVNLEAPVAAVSHSAYSLQAGNKLDTLTAWLRDNPQALVVVFTKMKHTAKKIGEKLSKVGFSATALHGNLSQAKRLSALKGFRQGDYTVLIATDIAARGIDVDGITHVFNYDMPDTLDAYIHRTGRAGRASRAGDAISFITREDRGMVRAIEKWLGKPLNGLEALDISDLPAELKEKTERGERSPRREARSNRRDRPSSDRPRGGRFSDRPRDGRGRGRDRFTEDSAAQPSSSREESQPSRDDRRAKSGLREEGRQNGRFSDRARDGRGRGRERFAQDRSARGSSSREDGQPAREDRRSRGGVTEEGRRPSRFAEPPREGRGRGQGRFAEGNSFRGGSPRGERQYRPRRDQRQDSQGPRSGERVSNSTNDDNRGNTREWREWDQKRFSSDSRGSSESQSPFGRPRRGQGPRRGQQRVKPQRGFRGGDDRPQRDASREDGASRPRFGRGQVRKGRPSGSTRRS